MNQLNPKAVGLVAWFATTGWLVGAFFGMATLGCVIGLWLALTWVMMNTLLRL